MIRFFYTAALVLTSLLGTTQQKAIPAAATGGSLNEGARMLFQQSGSRLSAAEKNVLFR